VSLNDTWGGRWSAKVSSRHTRRLNKKINELGRISPNATWGREGFEIGKKLSRII